MHRRAHSLIEILVVIAIILILAALVAGTIIKLRQIVNNLGGPDHSGMTSNR